MFDCLITGEGRGRVEHDHIDAEKIADGVEVFLAIESAEHDLTAGAG